MFSGYMKREVGAGNYVERRGNGKKGGEWGMRRREGNGEWGRWIGNGGRG